MLDAEARIVSRRLLLELLVDAEDAVNCQIAIGVRGKLPAGGVSFASGFIELFAAGKLQAP